MDNRNNIAKVDGSDLSDGQDDKGEDQTKFVQMEANQQDGSKPEGLSKGQQNPSFCSSSPAHVLDGSSEVQRDVQKQEQTEGDAQNVPEDGSVLPAGEDDEGGDSTPSRQTEPNWQDGSKPEDLSKNLFLKKADETEDSGEKDSEGQQNPPFCSSSLAHVLDGSSEVQRDVQKQEQTEGDAQNVPEVDGTVLSAGQDDKEEDSTPSLQTEANQQGGSKPEDLSRHWPVIIGVLVVAVAVYFLHGGSSPEPRKDRSVDIFHREFEKMKSSFPSQRAELWKRSKIHLERHLQTAQPTEPVSMILTSGRRAERTLSCLASHVAAAFSSALNASVLHIDGVSSTTLESDQVKLDIDEKLRGAFQSDRRAAVVHRFEELPPGSTLIFYRYCDHENAAFKGVSLIFTVLLGKDELNSHLRLSTVEEIVQDHIQDKFLSSAQPASFDKMDMDKFSGLWSRISHLILPVAAEEHIEQQGCKI